jgi:hypothetical protein
MTEPSQPKAVVEQDGRFPSGPWTGFFLQPEIPPGRHAMDLSLTFREGLIRGEGRDRLGSFLIRGRYELADGKCHWSKRYLGKHDVVYQGYNEGRGIWGQWQIPPSWHGGFYIWPVAMGDPTLKKKAEALDEPVLVSPPTAEPVGATAGGEESTFESSKL